MIIGKILTKALQSGKAIGGEMKVTEVTQFLAEHPQGITEQIGNLLGGKGKKVSKMVNSMGGMESLTAKLNELAKQYPEAAVKLGIKKSKQGYTIVSGTLRDGDKVIGKSATSVTNAGEIKTRSKILDTETRGFVDKDGFRFESEDKLTRIQARGTKEKGATITIGKENEVAVAHIKPTGDTARKVCVETDAGMTSLDAQTKGYKIDAIINNEEAAKLKHKTAMEVKKLEIEVENNLEKLKQYKKYDPDGKLDIKILRSLKERFETAIDLFKYNKHTDFERFLSKDELSKYTDFLKKIKEKEGNISKIKITEEELFTPKQLQEMKYIKQVDSDIECANKLLKIRI